MEGSRASSSSEIPLAATCERPKSASFARPSAVSSRFSGLRSLWRRLRVRVRVRVRVRLRLRLRVGAKVGAKVGAQGWG